MTDSKRPVSNGQLYYRHSLSLRITHWINAIVLAVLLMSGLNVFNAHPALYWGKSSYTGAPPVLELGAVKTAAGELKGVTRVFGRKFYTTGFLGASGGRKEGSRLADSLPGSRFPAKEGLRLRDAGTFSSPGSWC